MDALLVLQRHRKSFDDLELLFGTNGLYYILLDADEETEREIERGWEGGRMRATENEHYKPRMNRHPVIYVYIERWFMTSDGCYPTILPVLVFGL